MLGFNEQLNVIMFNEKNLEYSRGHIQSIETECSFHGAVTRIELVLTDNGKKLKIDNKLIERLQQRNFLIDLEEEKANLSCLKKQVNEKQEELQEIKDVIKAFVNFSKKDNS